MKFSVLAVFLFLGTETSAFDMKDPNCDALGVYHSLEHVRNIAKSCAPEETELVSELGKITEQIHDHLLAFHPDKGAELAAKRKMFKFSSPANCKNAEKDGMLQWIADWEKHLVQADTLLEKFLSGRTTNDWMKCDE